MTEVEENRRQKSEEKQVRDNEYKLRGIYSCDGQIGGMVEVLSVLILMLIPPKINAVSSILRLWTAYQVI